MLLEFPSQIDDPGIPSTDSVTIEEWKENSIGKTGTINMFLELLQKSSLFTVPRVDML